MTTNESLLQAFKNLYQIDLSAYDEDFLTKIVQQRMDDTRCLIPDYYIGLLQNDPGEVKLLQNALKVAYSEFFRNPLTYIVLEKMVLPDLISEKQRQNKKEIRIWTMATATGHEAYTLAIILQELMEIYKPEKLSFRIFATDHDQQLINQAKRGVYSIQSLNKMNNGRLKKWFVEESGHYRINPILTKRIDFSVFDLFDTECTCPPNSIFGDFDLILCSNLLFYYKEGYRNQILNKAKLCLTKEGYIVTGETERDMLPPLHYKELYPHSAIFSMIR